AVPAVAAADRDRRAAARARTLGTAALKRDDFSSNRYPALGPHWWGWPGSRRSLAGIGPAGNVPPVGQAFCDDPGRLHRRLAAAREFHDVALDAVGLVLQSHLQHFQLLDEPVDLMHRVQRH